MIEWCRSAANESGSPSWTRIELFVSRHRWDSGAFWRKSARWVSVIRPNLLRRDLWHLDLSFDYPVLRLSDSFHIQVFFKRGPSWCALFAPTIAVNE
jgi:hypothetical protein